MELSDPNFIMFIWEHKFYQVDHWSFFAQSLRCMDIIDHLKLGLWTLVAMFTYPVDTLPLLVSQA